MAAPNPTEAYRRAAIENAPPLKLVQMLYQGSLRFLAEARAAHEADDRPRFTQRVGKAQAIVAELRNSLDLEQSAELCAHLDSLYVFVQSTLMDMTIECSTDGLDEVEAILRTLLEAWRELDFEGGSA